MSGQPCGCDPDVPHMCDRHAGEEKLRDTFAGQYLAGRAARGEIEDFDESAAQAYQMADAMLIARDRRS